MAFFFLLAKEISAIHILDFGFPHIIIWFSHIYRAFSKLHPDFKKE